MESYDFSGWATRHNVKCSDGRTIREDAFKHCDGKKVPLVWNHQHNSADNVLGHALLENRKEGVYAYCFFNNNESGQYAKELVEHGDVNQLSIYANQLKQVKDDVLHGTIRELSIVLAGANPEAFIDNIIRHGEDGTDIVVEDEAIIITGEPFDITHADSDKETESESEGESGDKTIGELLDSLDDDVKDVVYAIAGFLAQQAIEHNDNDENTNLEGEISMKENVFDQETKATDNVISHSDMMAVINDAKRYGSMRESAIQHGIEDIEYLFPFVEGDGHNLNTPPAFIKRDTGWVSKVMNAVHHTPFSRIKSMFADLREEDARAKGYMKGKYKKEEVFALLKRATAPTTIYKKQKIDRDDQIDITDFDVVAWLKSEMRMMLDEEIARAILVGDGRLPDSDDKIKEDCIRPVWKDEDLYTIKAVVDGDNYREAEERAKQFIRTVIKARKDYKGSGEPTLYTTEDMLTDCLLLEDGIGHFLYESAASLAKVLRVKEIVTVPVMEGLARLVGNKEHDLMGIIVNLADYNVGADKGGAVNMFEDFDIDYNAQKYLIETRCSGALVKPFSAIAVECATTRPA